MKNKFSKIWLICISLIVLGSLILPSVFAVSGYIDNVLVSTKDCTSPPASTYLNQCSPASSFTAGQQVWHCIKLITPSGGSAITANFYVDGQQKKSNSFPAYHAPKDHQIRCDYYKTYTNADVGTHKFKGEVSPCGGGACSKEVSFEIKAAPLPAQPKFTITSVYMKDSNGNKKTTFNKGEKIKGCTIIKNLGDGDGAVTLKNYFLPSGQLLNSASNNLAPNNIMESCSSLPLINIVGTYGYTAKITPCSAPQKCAKSVHFKIT